MSTRNTGRTGTKGAYDDLRDAIEAHALVRASDGTAIASAEYSHVLSPWIFDFRSLIMRAEWMDRIAEIFWEIYGGRGKFQVGGVETAGIPLVAAIVMKGVQRKTPVNGFYIRASRKRYGLMRSIEGVLTDDPIIFVDDLLNSGRTINKQLAVLEAEGKRVSDVFTILAYRSEDSYSFLKDRGIALKHLFTLKDFDLPLQDGRSPATVRDDFEIMWRYRGAQPGFQFVVQKSTPAVDDKRVYAGFDDGIFRAFDRETGVVVWEYAIGKHPRGKAILSSPIINNGTIYFGAYDGAVHAIDSATGTRIWSYDDADWVGSSPDIDRARGILYIGLEYGLIGKRGGIAALDARSGKLLWHARHPQFTHGSPLYIEAESLVVIGSNDGVLYAYDALSGALRWSFATRGDIKSRPAYEPGQRAVIVGSLDGCVYAISATNGAVIYVKETGAGIYASPLVSADTLYATSLDKCVYALDAETGKTRWTFETEGRVFASPALHEGSLWIGSNDGRLYELEARTGKLVSSFQTSERIVSKIAHHENTLFVPTIGNELYCIQKRIGSAKKRPEHLE